MENLITMTSELTVGLDVGDKVTRFCVLDQDAQIVAEGAARTSPEHLRGLFQGYQGATVALEVGPHSRWLDQMLVELGCTVYVANARQLRLIYASKDKDDKLDAMRLARLARFDPSLLMPVKHRDNDRQSDLEVLKARSVLVRARTMLINHIRGVLKSFGIKPPVCDAPAFPKRLRDAGLAENLRVAIEPLLEQIEEITKKIRGFNRSVEEIRHERYGKEFEAVRQVNGVGPLTGLTFVLTIGDPHRFKKSRDVGAFLGLRPRRSESGDSSPELRITRHGDRFLRNLLVQSAHYILGPFGEDCDLRSWGLSKAQGGSRAKKRAVVAVARKLAVLLHRLMLTGERYEPKRATAAQAA